MDLHWFSIIVVDLGRFWGVAGLEGLATCGALWQPVAHCGDELDGDPTPYKQVNKKIRCIEPGGSGGEEVGEWWLEASGGEEVSEWW